MSKKTQDLSLLGIVVYHTVNAYTTDQNAIISSAQKFCIVSLYKDIEQKYFVRSCLSILVLVFSVDNKTDAAAVAAQNSIGSAVEVSSNKCMSSTKKRERHHHHQHNNNNRRSSLEKY